MAWFLFQNILASLPSPGPQGVMDEDQIFTQMYCTVVPCERNPEIMKLRAYIGQLTHLSFLPSLQRETYSGVYANDSGEEQKDVCRSHFISIWLQRRKISTSLQRNSLSLMSKVFQPFNHLWPTLPILFAEKPQIRQKCEPVCGELSLNTWYLVEYNELFQDSLIGIELMKLNYDRWKLSKPVSSGTFTHFVREDFCVNQTQDMYTPSHLGFLCFV